MTLVSSDYNWLLLCCGHNFAFFHSSILSQTEESSNASVPGEQCGSYQTILQSTTSLFALKEALLVAKSNLSESTNGAVEAIVDRNGATNKLKEELLGSITCCFVSGKHSKAAFGTDLKHVWIFDLLSTDCKFSSDGCNDIQVILLAVVCLDKRPVSLSILSGETILVGEKAGFISKIELNRKQVSRSCQKLKNFYIPVLNAANNLSVEKSDDAKNRKSEGFNHIFAPFDLRVTLCAGCVSSLLVQMKVQPNYEQLVALCDRDMKIKIYNYPDMFNIESVLMGHTDYVTSCCFMGSDYELLLSASFDGTLKLWNVRSGKCLTTVNLTASIEATNGAKSTTEKEEIVQNKEEHEKGNCKHMYGTLLENVGRERALIATKNPCQVILCHLSRQPVTNCNEEKGTPLIHTITYSEHVKDEYISINITHCEGFAGADITCVEKMNASNLVFVGLRYQSTILTDTANGSAKDGALKNVQLLSCLNSNDAGNCNNLNWKLDNLSQRDIVRDKFGGIYDLQRSSFFEPAFKCRLDFETVNPNPFQSGLFSANRVEELGVDMGYFGLSPISISPKISGVESGKVAPESGKDTMEGVDAEPLTKMPKVDEQLGSM